MTGGSAPRSDTLLRRLRRMRVLVIHPDDPEREMFLSHLRRIGCQVEKLWPAPSALPDGIDVVLFLVNRIHEQGALSWMSGADDIARIGIISFETQKSLRSWSGCMFTECCQSRSGCSVSWLRSRLQSALHAMRRV